ncbi:MAG: type II toxin-antitoxin system prevent-host-death family antitoxin [Planctomycetota bacterium]
MTMEVNISELKAKLSAYLDRVRKGETVTILDRKTPIARIVPLEEGPDDLVIHPATEPLSTMKDVKGVPPLEDVDVVEILGELRGDR